MLTPREKVAFDYIKEQVNKGHTPTARELTNAMNLKSSASGEYYIYRLTIKGYIQRTNEIVNTNCKKIIIKERDYE